ncbi:hypothetical protein CYMTET_32863 [Cymbomonas tetramitiformis]|uniref:Cyclin-D1-binding protein 1-like N-terminal domain-containing protein n=1 Tax=Cymbomonas tetramitiformis TaxID=36881 RepID=A0AAE0KRS9_9CHLO|nr:hypothetical protein CYMTET_32863 [Cymbomonas tetramitiformis]
MSQPTLGETTAVSVKSVLCTKWENVQSGQDRRAEGSNEKMSEAADLVYRKSCELAILWADASTVDQESAESSLQSFEVTCIALREYCKAHYPCAGPSLLKAVEKGLGDVGDACFEFLKFITSSNQQKQQVHAERGAQLVGVLKEKCKLLSRLPTDNRAAIGRALVKAAATLKDVVREVDELELGGKDGDEADYELEDEADDVVDFDTDFGPEDVKIVDAAKPLMAGSLALAKSIVKAVATGSEPAEEKDLLVLERLNGER